MSFNKDISINQSLIYFAHFSNVGNHFWKKSELSEIRKNLEREYFHDKNLIKH